MSIPEHSSPDMPNEPNEPVPAERGVRVVHLVFGVVFLGIAGLWALATTDNLTLDVSAGYLFPLVLIVAGAAGLVASLANGASTRRQDRATRPDA